MYVRWPSVECELAPLKLHTRRRMSEVIGRKDVRQFAIVFFFVVFGERRGT